MKKELGNNMRLLLKSLLLHKESAYDIRIMRKKIKEMSTNQYCLHPRSNLNFTIYQPQRKNALVHERKSGGIQSNNKIDT